MTDTPLFTLRYEGDDVVLEIDGAEHRRPVPPEAVDADSHETALHACARVFIADGLLPDFAAAGELRMEPIDNT